MFVWCLLGDLDVMSLCGVSVLGDLAGMCLCGFICDPAVMCLCGVCFVTEVS